MVESFKHKFTRLQEEILEFLFENAGSSFNQRNLAKELKVSSTAIAKSLKELKDKQLINLSKDKSTNIISISMNRDNPRAINLKRVYNLKTIYESGIAKYLEDNFFSATIILFGSYSFGEDIFTLDIDLAIIGAKEKEIDIKKYESILKKKIIIQFYPSLKEVHKNLRDNLLNGIILKGGINL